MAQTQMSLRNESPILGIASLGPVFSAILIGKLKLMEYDAIEFPFVPDKHVKTVWKYTVLISSYWQDLLGKQKKKRGSMAKHPQEKKKRKSDNLGEMQIEKKNIFFKK